MGGLVCPGPCPEAGGLLWVVFVLTGLVASVWPAMVCAPAIGASPAGPDGDARGVPLRVLCCSKCCVECGGCWESLLSWPCLVMSFFPAPQFHWSRSPKVVRASLGGWSGGSTGCSLWFSRCVLSWVDLVCTHLLCPAVCVSLLPVCRISVVCVSSLTVF